MISVQCREYQPSPRRAEDVCLIENSLGIRHRWVKLQRLLAGLPDGVMQRHCSFLFPIRTRPEIRATLGPEGAGVFCAWKVWEEELERLPDRTMHLKADQDILWRLDVQGVRAG